jgi:hypothetical protein
MMPLCVLNSRLLNHFNMYHGGRASRFAAVFVFGYGIDAVRFCPFATALKWGAFRREQAPALRNLLHFIKFTL